MDTYRFYVPDLLTQAATSGPAGPIHLPDDQAHHARAVLRMTAGQPVILFDGHGGWASGKIAGESGKPLGKGSVSAHIEGGLHSDPPPAVMLTIAAATPKGERAEWLVEQASQLNVARLQWLECDRGVVKPGAGKIEKWRRLAAESAKQCGRTHLMEVAEPAGIEAILRTAGVGEKVLWLEPRERSSVRVAEAMAGISRGSVLALVGPEGGWSEWEFHLLESAAGRGEVTRVRLTETVLRIETACAAVAAAILCAI